jgi:hypothetical protein
MTGAEREAIISELTEAFGDATDVTPADGQPLHVLLPSLPVLSPWRPSPTRAVLRFVNWPRTRPEFYVDPELKDANGNPPVNPYDYYVLGRTWRGFSFQFPWPTGDGSATQSVMQWLNRFRLT